MWKEINARMALRSAVLPLIITLISSKIDTCMAINGRNKEK